MGGYVPATFKKVIGYTKYLNQNSKFLKKYVSLVDCIIYMLHMKFLSFSSNSANGILFIYI